MYVYELLLLHIVYMKFLLLFMQYMYMDFCFFMQYMVAAKKTFTLRFRCMEKEDVKMKLKTNKGQKMKQYKTKMCTCLKELLDSPHEELMLFT